MGIPVYWPRRVLAGPAPLRMYEAPNAKPAGRVEDQINGRAAVPLDTQPSVGVSTPLLDLEQLADVDSRRSPSGTQPFSEADKLPAAQPEEELSFELRVWQFGPQLFVDSSNHNVGMEGQQLVANIAIAIRRKERFTG